MLSAPTFTLCALGVRDAYLTGLKSRSCQQLPGVVLASLCGPFEIAIVLTLSIGVDIVAMRQLRCQCLRVLSRCSSPIATETPPDSTQGVVATRCSICTCSGFLATPRFTSSSCRYGSQHPRQGFDSSLIPMPVFSPPHGLPVFPKSVWATTSNALGN